MKLSVHSVAKFSGRESENHEKREHRVENKVKKKRKKCILPPFAARSHAAPLGNNVFPACLQGMMVNLLRGVPLASLPFVQMLFRSLWIGCSYYLYPENGNRELCSA